MRLDDLHRYTPEKLTEGTVLVCVRDPDASNEYAGWTNGPAGVFVLDIDAGRDDLSDPEEYADWAEGLEAVAGDLGACGHPDAARYVRDVIANYNPEGD